MLRHRHYGRFRATWLRTVFAVLMLLMSLAAAALLGLLVYRTAPHTYAATSSMLVSSQPDIIAAIIAGGASNLMGASSEALATPGTRGNLASLWAILTSREMLVRIVHKHDLSELLSPDESDTVDELSTMTRFTQISDVGVSVTVACPGSRYARSGSLVASPLTLGQARDLCAELANSYLTELENYVTETNLQQARQMREFLETSKQETERRLEAIEQDLELLQSSHAFLDPQNKAQQLLERLKSVEPAYAAAAAYAQEVAEKHQAAQSQLDGLCATRISQEVIARNPVITTLEEKLAQLQADLQTEQVKGKTDQHREVVRLKAAIDSTKQQLQEIKEEVRQSVSTGANPAYDAVVAKVVDLETELVGARTRRDYYAGVRKAVAKALAELPSVARAYVSLNREQEQHAQLLDPLAQGLELVSLVEKYSHASRFLRLDTAVPPQRPSSSPLIVSAVVALVVFLLGILIVIAYLRGTFGIFGV